MNAGSARLENIQRQRRHGSTRGKKKKRKEKSFRRKVEAFSICYSRVGKNRWPRSSCMVPNRKSNRNRSTEFGISRTSAQKLTILLLWISSIAAMKKMKRSISKIIVFLRRIYSRQFNEVPYRWGINSAVKYQFRQLTSRRCDGSGGTELATCPDAAAYVHRGRHALLRLKRENRN